MSDPYGKRRKEIQSQASTASFNHHQAGNGQPSILSKEIGMNCRYQREVYVYMCHD